MKRVIPISIIDNIHKAWNLWDCEIEDEHGNLVKGSIEGDGHDFKMDTFIPDEE